MEYIRDNDAPDEPVIEFQQWLDTDLLHVLGDNAELTYEGIWDDEDLRKLACQYMLALGHNRINIVRLDAFYREFATCGDTLHEQATSLMDGNVCNDDALDLALFAPKQARVTWPEMVRHKADQLRAAVLDKAPEWDFVQQAYADDCEREEMRKRCPCRFSGGCVGC